ncbi:MAG: hypothetical protein K9H26_19625 [Prolixibacteraceae bacterium]|nr:hypothetical protein [Prolixibacteraceae bacterium]
MQIGNNPSCQVFQYYFGRIMWHIVMRIFLLQLVFCPKANYAQLPSDATSNASLAEKIYLQTDRQVYFTNDTIWFKCIVASAFNHKPTTLSGVLYVELIAPTERIAQKKLIKLSEGIGSGYFGIGTGEPEGTYQIRAYTQWNLNFGGDFIFTRYLNVFANSKQNEIAPISEVTLFKKQDGKQQLKACFDPLAIDSLHRGRLTVYFSANGISDSLLIGKGKNDKYWLDYDLDDSCRFVTLKMRTDNMANSIKTILLDKDYANLQFFPESGELVHGLPSKVGYKALDVNGKGIFVQGDIVDENDSIITAFESNALGMGSFVLPVADKARTYYARMASKLDSNQLLLVPLPKVNPVGNTLSIEKRGDRFLLIAASNYLDSISINLVVSCRGIVYFNQKASLTDGVWGGTIPASMLPDGIIFCTMLDNTMQPVAERLFFNQRPEERLQVQLTTDKDSYAKREKTNLNIKTTDYDGVPLNANLSVLVINKEQLGGLQSEGQNILSYFLLDSELKGEIETPCFYFNGDGTLEDLDALMLTQGWRKYLYSKPYNELPFKPEKGLSVTGRVTSGLFDKEQVAKLSIMSFGDGFQAATTMTDSTGRFRFDLDDEYGDEMTVVIQSAKESGKNTDYVLSLDQITRPPVNFTQISPIAELDSVVVELVKKDEERKKVDDAFRATSGSIMIGQVDVDGYKRSPKSKYIIERAGEPDMVIDGKKIHDNEVDWSYGLYSMLSYSSNFTIDVWQKKYSLDFEVSVLGSDYTLVLVDGEYDRLNQDLIATLPVSEVSSIDIIKCADNFKIIYFESTDIFIEKLIFCGSIININTYAGKGVLNAYYKPKGINKFRIPVFATPKEFYSPNFDSLTPEESNKPDLRALLYWQAILATDSTGTATTGFYNADNVGAMTVVVEAISDEGKIGYKEMDYKVEGKQTKLIIVE